MSHMPAIDLPTELTGLRLVGRDTNDSGPLRQLTPAVAAQVLASSSGGGTVNYLRADGTWAPAAGSVVVDAASIIGAGVTADKFRLNGAAVGFVSAKSYSVTGDGTTDDRANLVAAASAASTLGAALELGVGTFRVTRDGSNAWCLDFSNYENLVIRGVKGKTKILAATGLPDAGGIPVVRFNNCKGGGIYDVAIDGNWGNYSGVVTYLSSGLALPQTTINVDSTDGAASSGTFGLVVGTTLQTITYTGRTATTFTGCSGGTGTIRTGAGVGYLDSATGINHTTQADPRNHGIMLRGCENFEVHGVQFADIYGDMVWVGFLGVPIEDGLKPCKNIRIVGCFGKLAARHGVSISQCAEDITIHDCQWRHIYGIPVDAEAQGLFQFIRRLRIDGGYYGLWWNPSSAGRNFSGSISIKGAGVLGLLEADCISDCSVSNATIEGSVSVWAGRGVTLFNNRIVIDFDHGASNGSYAPVFIDHVCDGVDVLYNSIYDRGAVVGLAGVADSDPARASIVVQSYSTSLRPAGVRIIGNKIQVRNGRDGIKISGAGGQVGGTQNYTATSVTSTTLVVAAAGWVTSEHIGKTIYRAGLVASVAANDATTLTFSGWFRPTGAGAIEPTPTAGAFRMFAPSGVVRVENNDIDCIDDGNGAGKYGISVYTKLSGGAVRVRGNTVRGATTDAYHFDLTASYSTLLEVTGNHAYDDQQVKTTVAGYSFAGTEFLTQLIIHGNSTAPGITHLSGLTAGSWQTSDSWPASYAGYVDPNGSIYAAATATYQRIDSKVVYVKQSPESSNVGWQTVTTQPRAVVRGVGTARGTASTSIDLTNYMPPSAAGDIEVLIAWDHDATTAPTLSTPAGFVQKLSGNGTLTYANRTVVWWRRFQAGNVAPVISVPAGFAGAVVVSLRDIIPYGDPFDTAVFQASPDGNNAITFPTTTTTTDNALVLNVLTTYCGGGGATPGHFDSWTNSSLTELEEILDTRIVLTSDIINVSVLSSRKVTAGAITATTATGYDSSQSDSTLTLTFKPAVVAARATGTITCVAKASLVDGEYITIGDGINAAKLYEFDLVPNGVVAGRVVVDVSADTTAIQVAARLRTAIIANHPTLLVIDNGNGTLSLTHNWIGTGGNVTMTENVANAGFLVTGMSGGAG